MFIQNDSSSEDDKRFRLNKKFFLKLLEYERQFSKKIESIAQIQNLVALYGQCVEFFDTLANPVKYYFMEKIQMALAEGEAFEIILQQEQQNKKKAELQRQIKPVKHETNVSDNPLKRSKINSQHSANKNIIVPKQPTTPTPFKEDIESAISLTKNRQTRQKKLTMTATLYEQKEQNNQSGLLDGWDAEVNQADYVINEQLKQQQEKFENRLNSRKDLKSQKSLDSTHQSLKNLTEI
ncbi:hypothetical protein pb186bvf_014078 [Paramecium bursaria]